MILNVSGNQQKATDVLQILLSQHLLETQRSTRQCQHKNIDQDSENTERL